MKNNLVSIITPVYNSEKFLNQLFKNIDDQKYKNYELILIDDGSKDNSGLLCKEYAKKNNRVKYIYKENTGVSDTRNVGLKAATGDYICFIDSDDLVEKEYLSDLVKYINNADFSCGLLYKFKDENKIQNNCELGKIIELKEKNIFDLIYKGFGGYIANKLFKTSIIKKNNIEFEKNISMCEDLLFVFNYLKQCNKAICFEKRNYNYRISDASSSKTLSNKKWFSIFNVQDILLKNKELFSEYTNNQINFMYLYYLYSAKYRLRFINKDDRKKFSKNINERIKKSKNNYKKLSFVQKNKIFIYKRFNKIAFYYKFKKELKMQ